MVDIVLEKVFLCLSTFLLGIVIGCIAFTTLSYLTTIYIVDCRHLIIIKPVVIFLVNIIDYCFIAYYSF